MIGRRIADDGLRMGDYERVAVDHALGLGAYRDAETGHVCLTRDGIVFLEAARLTREDALVSFEAWRQRLGPLPPPPVVLPTCHNVINSRPKDRRRGGWRCRRPATGDDGLCTRCRSARKAADTRARAPRW